VSLGVTVMRILPGDAISVSPSTLLLAFAMLLPVTLFITAIFLALAAFAKDFKDGQNFLTPVYMLLAMPAGVTMLRGIELNAWTAFVPVVNIALLIKRSSSRKPRPTSSSCRCCPRPRTRRWP